MTGRIAVLPQVGHGVRLLVRGAGAVLGEIGWWLAGAWRLVAWAPRRMAAWLTGGVFAAWAEIWSLLTGLAAVVLLLGLWARLWPVSFHQRVARPSWRRRTRRSVKRSWAGLMVACGLSRRVADRTGVMVTRVPALHRSRWDEPDVLVTMPQLMIGQTVEDVVTASERLRVAVGSRQVRVIPNDTHTGCTMRFLFADPLAAVVEARFPSPNLAPNITTAQMGVTENGDPWFLPIQVHTLTAGASGSGKASAMWMLLLNLAPAIRTGLVQVHGIDLKGGVEHALGARLFTRRATTLDQAVMLLEDAVIAMVARAATIAGHARSHTPSPAAPLVIIVIDELAMLTSYSTDRELLRRADSALRSLLALGRAPGYVVYGYLQDPRKDTVPQRHLFNQSYALRLREREEVVMVLSEGAVAAGATCHKIPRSTPGIGYVLTEGGDTMRVRIAHVPDPMIRALADHFPAPTQIPVVVPLPAENMSRPSPRSRKTTGTRSESRPS
ncbi:FtsK/SpoIIIE domain-containing protein [Microlunatus aurantiacus]|uniref:FtsK/SpoIIIE domain-containing protein n=1 Tax=Microlunatus aurantiacus TaxID=446786 RepID=A0ABP7EK88_9ACTN